jgi:hypothetical protein
LVFLRSEDKNGLPTAQQAAAEKKRKVERVYLGSAGESG